MNQLYGVALFNEPSEYKDGWAAIGGSIGREPFSFESTGELSNDVIWLTNMDADLFFRAGLMKTPRFRHSQYLRTKLSSMILELGLKNVDLPGQAIILANIFNNIMKITKFHIGISGAPINTLSTGLKQVIQPEIDVFSPKVRDASSKACQSFVQCMKPYETLDEDSQIVSLVFHRQKYAHVMKTYDLPTGNWEKASSVILAQSNEQLLDWVCDHDKPCLIEVDIMRIDSDINHLLNYGSGAGVHIKKAQNGKNWAGLNQREWMTTPELKIIRKYTDLIVKDILIGEGYIKNPIKLPEWGGLSYSTGILNENIWVSLTKDLTGKNAKTPQSAWLHSIDRMLCFLTAKKIEKSNFATIHSYGYGRITICIPDNNFKNLIDLAARIGMIAPMPEEEDCYNRKITKDAPHELVFEAIMERRAFHLIEKLDNEAIKKAKELKNRQSKSIKVTL
ncbi:MAG: hypothetical protein QM500_12060 [Methylococcales bacterium]